MFRLAIFRNHLKSFVLREKDVNVTSFTNDARERVNLSPECRLFSVCNNERKGTITHGIFLTGPVHSQ